MAIVRVSRRRLGDPRDARHTRACPRSIETLEDAASSGGSARAQTPSTRSRARAPRKSGERGVAIEASRRAEGVSGVEVCEKLSLFGLGTSRLMCSAPKTAVCVRNFQPLAARRRAPSLFSASEASTRILSGQARHVESEDARRGMLRAHQSLAGAGVGAGGGGAASAAACAAAFARAALRSSSRAIFLASMSSTLVGDGAAVAARETSRGMSPAAATTARRDACHVAHPAHSHVAIHGVSPQDAQTSREGPYRGWHVAASRAGPRAGHLQRFETRGW